MAEISNIRKAPELDELAARVDRLEPGDRLRLAASLIEAGRARLAETIARAVVDELAARRLFTPGPSSAPGRWK